MCGVAGYLDFDGAPASQVVLERMAEAIRHRGPDGEGYFTDGSLGLAHRRLAILDLSPAGHQPMTCPDGRYVLSYNGEVYNYQELRIQLEGLGHQFHSRTDSEVVLHALVQWGRDALSRLNGMFAFALWDRRERTLLLARDRYGIKPLYVARQGDRLFFGSEVKALMAHPDFMSRMNLEGLREYLTFQNFVTDQTLFQDVELLQAGTWTTVTQDGDIHQGRYWDYDFREPENATDPAALEEELAHLFEQAVSRQLIADVSVDSYLSGGMDSGSISCVAARQRPSLRTFTVGFDAQSASGMEISMDERPAAEYMSYVFGTEHYEMVLKAGDMQRCMKDLVWHLEEPRVGQSYPNYYAAKLASRFGKVVLTGAGGDELFGGYPWRYYRAVVNDDFEHYIDKYYRFWQRLIRNSRHPGIFSPVWEDVKDVWTRDMFRDVFVHHADTLYTPEDYINHSLYFEAKTFLHGLLVVEDKLSMAHSLENRVPFLDNDLVDFAQHLPVSTKLGNLGEVVRLNENNPGPKTQEYFNKTSDGKLILRRTMQRYIPEKVTSAIKQGFSAPDANWFRGESIDYVRDILCSPRARIFDFVDRDATLAMVDEHLSGQVNRRLLVWSLLYLEESMGLFFNQH